MPVHLGLQPRRQFLSTVAACSATAVLATMPQTSLFGQDRDTEFLALLSDTHIPDNPDVVARDVNMTNNLRTVVSQITQLATKPAHLFINGDCAYLKGMPEDYKNLAQCLAPLADAQIPVHLTMGNHDDRAPLYEALKNQRPKESLVQSKHVSIIEGRFANWFLLDSLDKVNVVSGALGAEQLEWLTRELKQRRDKPALVMAHHNPQFEAPEEGKSWFGISDTASLFELLDSMPHVKAFIFGHSHTWKYSKRNSLHLVNLPPVAYVFENTQPNGWVEAIVNATSVRFRLQSLDAKHPKHNDTVEIPLA